MKTHKIKLDECYWHEVMMGAKTFEVRKNDRDYELLDGVIFTFDNLESPIFYITYILYGGQFGIDSDYCVFSIQKINTRASGVPK